MVLANKPCAGDVIDIRIFQFTLLEIGNWVHADQSTGRVVHIPNASIFREVQANYSKGFCYIWDEIEIHVTFESNWQKAKQILEEVLIEFAKHSDIEYAYPAQRLYFNKESL